MINSKRKLLREWTMKQLQAKQERKKILKSKSVRVWYWGIRITDKNKFLTLYYKALDFKGSGKKHLVRIILDSYPAFSEEHKDKSQEEIIKLALLTGEIRIHCTCSDFLYGGYAYIADKKKYGIVKEPRPPVIRNPSQQGSLCKHCSAVTVRAPLFLKSVTLDVNKKNYKKSVRIKTGDKIYII